LKDEAAQKEEQMLMMEGEYKNIQDEMESKSKMVSKLRK